MTGWKAWVLAGTFLALGGAGGFVIDSRQGMVRDKQASMIEVPIAAERFSAPPAKEAAPPGPIEKKKAPKKKVGAAPHENSGAQRATSTTKEVSKEPFACDVSRSEIARRDVIFNEFAWAGKESDPRSQWLELKNSGRKTVDLKGWSILDAQGALLWRFKEKLPLKRGEFAVIEAEQEDEEGELIYAFSLSKFGGWLKIFDADCNLRDEMVAPDGWQGGDLSTFRTLERKRDDRGWQTSMDGGGTPKKENSEGLPLPKPTLGRDANNGSTPLTMNGSVAGTSTESSPPPPRGGQGTLSVPLIVALHTTGGTGQSDYDAIKIYNPNDADYALGGWKLRKRAKTGTESSVKSFAEATIIPARGYFVWANSKFTEIAANATSTATLSDDNSVALFNKEDVVVDQVAWGGEHTNPFSEGAPYATNPGAGQWLTRKAEGERWRDTNSNADDFEMQ